jgi:hypothetical protein
MTTNTNQRSFRHATLMCADGTQYVVEESDLATTITATGPDGTVESYDSTCVEWLDLHIGERFLWVEDVFDSSMSAHDSGTITACQTRHHAPVPHDS